MSLHRSLWRPCVGLRLKGGDAWAASAVSEMKRWRWRDGQADDAGGQIHTVGPTDKHVDPYSAESHDCRVKTGTMQIVLSLYHGCYDNPIHLKLGVSSTRCRSGEEGQESCVRVSWFYSFVHPPCRPLLHLSAEVRFKKLEGKIPAQEFLIALVPRPKAFIYLKASLCPLWPHLAICCTCNGFSFMWPNWSCWHPVWDLISTM